jgi:hypothetical protein
VNRAAVAPRAPWRSPLGAVLLLALLARVVGPLWGLPASDGWDDDGVAPRDFLPGLVDTYAWGHHATYPPLQMILLALTTAPIWIATLLRAPSLAPPVLVATFVQVPTMTALAVVARVVTVAMSIGLLWNLARIGETLRRSSRAGAWTAASCAVCSVLTYYSQTSNLDVPYLFWGVLAVRRLVEAIADREPRALRGALVFAALAICTKDQAYALFLLSVPLALGGWLLLDPPARRKAPAVAAHLAAGAAAAAIIVLVVDGALFNPVGFAGRVRFLVGAASQDHATYAANAVGYARVARDAILAFGGSFPWTMAPLVVVGVAAALRAPDRALRAAGWVPALVALSFTVAFDITARRTEDRFVLPQMLMCGVYAGLGCDALQTWLGPRRVGALVGVVGVVAFAFVPAIFGCAAVDAAMVLDPRYDAERWLGANVQPGDRLEVYDNNAHLPRLPSGLVVERVDATPPAGRSPMPGVTEVRDRFSNVAARDPRFVVVSQFWAEKYLFEPQVVTDSGHVLSRQQEATRLDEDSIAYFHALRDGRLGYRLVHVAAPANSFWPIVDIHASLDREIWIYERSGGVRR